MPKKLYHVILVSGTITFPNEAVRAEFIGDPLKGPEHFLCESEVSEEDFAKVERLIADYDNDDSLDRDRD